MWNKPVTMDGVAVVCGCWFESLSLDGTTTVVEEASSSSCAITTTTGDDLLSLSSFSLCAICVAMILQ